MIILRIFVKSCSGCTSDELFAPKIGKNILIVAHGNSIRAIVKMLKKISNNDIVKLNIPTGCPYVFEFNQKFELISDRYLGNSEEIRRKTNLVASQGLNKS